MSAVRAPSTAEVVTFPVMPPLHDVSAEGLGADVRLPDLSHLQKDLLRYTSLGASDAKLASTFSSTEAEVATIKDGLIETLAPGKTIEAAVHQSILWGILKVKPARTSE